MARARARTWMCATTGSGPLQRGTGALIAPLVSLTGRRVPAPAISHRIQYSTRGGPARACARVPVPPRTQARGPHVLPTARARAGRMHEEASGGATRTSAHTSVAASSRALRSARARRGTADGAQALPCPSSTGQARRDGRFGRTATYAPMMLLMGMKMSLTKKPTKPITTKPSAVRLATLVYSAERVRVASA